MVNSTFAIVLSLGKGKWGTGLGRRQQFKYKLLSVFWFWGWMVVCGVKTPVSTQDFIFPPFHGEKSSRRQA